MLHFLQFAADRIYTVQGRKHIAAHLHLVLTHWHPASPDLLQWSLYFHQFPAGHCLTEPLQLPAAPDHPKALSLRLLSLPLMLPKCFPAASAPPSLQPAVPGLLQADLILHLAQFPSAKSEKILLLQLQDHFPAHFLML